MKYYINYADNIFKKQQKFALTMAKFFGNFDEVISYSKKDIDTDFYKTNKHILEQKRGVGYWLWKPYFVVKTIDKLKNGDYLFYCDAGAFFLKNVDILINEMEKAKQDIMGFELPLIEEQWTKKELFINLECNEEEYYSSNQILASFMLIKKNKKSSIFCKNWLEASCNVINITDEHDKNIKQKNNFIEHRHDQSIFSLLYKKNKLKSFKDPSQLGKHPQPYSSIKGIKITLNKLTLLENGRLFNVKQYAEKYKFIIFHHRSKSPIKSLLKYLIKECFRIAL
ncbi:MAG: hypothetical protein A2Y40_05420 [Candidatus Margulisbacteria bacterium GWF2_35_9]|nr:MAG: hypothetical protein A2Y40_05420 [Candidatus Margulisbacteria bacterium GWF2_35_9]